MKKISFGELRKILTSASAEERNTEKSVKSIIERVRRDGDKALIHFAQKFDGIKQKSIRVEGTEIEKAGKNLDVRILEAAKAAVKRVEKYHKKQIPPGFTMKEEGLTLEYRFDPIENAGIYIPAGQSPLISTLIMTAVPAKVAGVKNIYAASPPSCKGKIHPPILGLLGYLGIKDVFAMGGAQAMAAFACGTETVPRVDVIAGPGNKYVDTAKRLLYGTVGIDLPAGPSEVAVFAESPANMSFVEADLFAQGEHAGSRIFLITTSEKLGSEAEKRIKAGFWLLARDRREALEIINYIAPEHLQLSCRKPEEMIKKAVAGAVFAGDYSPAALGDYFAGPSHVLPTGRTARFASGLSVHTFLRSCAVIKAEKSFYARNGRLMEILAESEGLSRHCKSLSLRKKKKQ